MSKNKNKNAAKKAATTPVVNTTTTQVDNTSKAEKAEASTETKKEDVKPQVAAPAATDKKKEDPPKGQQQTKKEDKTPPPANKPAQKGTEQQQPKVKKDKTPTVIAEEVDPVKTLGNKIGVPMSKEGEIAMQRSSTDAKSRLVEYGYHRFVNNQEFKDKCPEAWKNTAQAIDAVWVLAMVEVQNELALAGAPYGLVAKVTPEQVMPLKEVADMLGITLAEPKMLPGGDPNQLTIGFSEEDGTIIPDELKDQTKNMTTAAPAVPELDPKKIENHDMLVAALSYLLRKERNIAVNIVNVVEWYRVYLIEHAKTGEDKIKYDNLSVFDRINEIFHIAEPQAILKGLGRSVYLYTKTHNSPVAAHALLHGNVKDCGWSEADTAEMLKALIQENFRYKLKEEPENSPKDDAAMNALICNLGNPYIDELFANLHMKADAEDPKEKLDQQAKIDQAKKIINLVSTNYFPQGVRPTEDAVRMVIGQIINTYRNPMDRLSEYENPDPIPADYPATKEADKPAEAPVVEKKN